MKRITFLFFLANFIILNAQTRIWNFENLNNAVKTPTEASKLIVKEADKMLTKTITAVVDKKTTPPSGDKHDYLSQGRYWWPNPKTADGLPYIRKDGVVNPEIEDFDRGALSAMTRSVAVLSLAYKLTSENKYAEKAVQNLRIWFMNKKTKMNPNMNYGQTIPGKYEGKGRGEGVLDTYSFVEMLDGVDLLNKSDEYTKKDRTAMKSWFTEYLNWLQTSEIAKEEFEAKNNHGTAFDVQITRYALFVGNEVLAKQYINAFAERRLFTQIQPDGSQPFELARTTALGYSTFNLKHFLDMSYLAKSIGLDLYSSTSTDGRSISKAIEFLVPYIGKTVEDFPYKQIKDWDKVQKELKWELYRADQLTKLTNYKEAYLQLVNSSQKDKNQLLY